MSYKPSNPISVAVLDEFFTYKIEQDKISPQTYTCYTCWLGRFINFIESNYDNCNLLEVTSDMILAWNKIHINKSSATKDSYMWPIKILYNWCVQPHIQKLKNNPVPYMKVGGKRQDIHFVPDPETIFRIRNLSNGFDLKTAVIFELLLSTGMRINELLQVRMGDVDFKDTVFDYELGKTSPYIGGSITVFSSRGIRLKSKGRRVFFGRLAAKLLRKYIRDFKLENCESDIPLFPYTYKTIMKQMHLVGMNAPKGILKTNKIKTQQRESGFMDIDISKLKTPQEYKDKLLRMQQQELNRQQDSKYKQASKLQRLRPLYLHCHALRHTFAAMMYYRNWAGQHHDLLSVRDLLGHSSVNMTQKYVSLANLCKSEAAWKRIFVGNDFEYMKLYRRINA